MAPGRSVVAGAGPWSVSAPGFSPGQRRFDSTFCLWPQRECGWCADIAALEAGEAFLASGRQSGRRCPHRAGTRASTTS